MQKEGLLGQRDAVATLLKLLGGLRTGTLHEHGLRLLRTAAADSAIIDDVRHDWHLHGLANQVVLVALIARSLGQEAE